MSEIIRNSQVIPVDCFVCGKEIKSPLEKAYLCFGGRIYRLCFDHDDLFALAIFAMKEMKKSQILAKGIKDKVAEAEQAKGGVS